MRSTAKRKYSGTQSRWPNLGVVQSVRLTSVAPASRSASRADSAAEYGTVRSPRPWNRYTGTPGAQLIAHYAYRVENRLEGVMQHGIADNAYLAVRGGSLAGSTSEAGFHAKAPGRTS